MLLYDLKNNANHKEALRWCKEVIDKQNFSKLYKTKSLFEIRDQIKTFSYRVDVRYDGSTRIRFNFSNNAEQEYLMFVMMGF